MSTRQSSRKKLLEHEFAIWFNLKRDDHTMYQCCLAMSNLNQAEQERIATHIKTIAMDFYKVLQPHLDVEQDDNIIHAEDLADHQAKGQ